MRRALAQKREELLVDRLRRVEVEEPFLGEELLRSYYDDHQDEFRVETQAVVEGGILSLHQQATAVAARAKAGEDLFEIMADYPLFLGEFRKYGRVHHRPGRHDRCSGCYGRGGRRDGTRRDPRPGGDPLCQ